MSEFIRTQTHGRVMEITIARPAARNALTLEMYDAMSAAFDAASADTNVRVLLVRGAEGTFTAGNDLKDFMVSPPSGEDSPVFQFLARLLTFAKPLVAAVDGHAVGIGTTMLFHCDLVYSSDRAKFKLPFVNLALVPEAGSSLILERMVGHQLASELLLLGETFGPELAERIGFVNATLPGDDVYAHALERAHELARRPPEAVRLTKQLLKGIERERLEEVMKAEAAFFVERLASPELAEAIAAFFEKREPSFD